jgi:CarD family transcriptional regulator
MFKINDYVIYGLTGVCQITDIGKDEYAKDNDTQYYVLTPVFSSNMTIRLPVNSRKVRMRPVMTKEQVLDLIATMPEQETLWTDDDRQRSASFQTALRSGKSEEWVKLIKTLYTEKETRSTMGKKLTKTDEDLMNNAERQLYQEFAIALGISPDEVLDFIQKYVPEKVKA